MISWKLALLFLTNRHVINTLALEVNFRMIWKCKINEPCAKYKKESQLTSTQGFGFRMSGAGLFPWWIAVLVLSGCLNVWVTPRAIEWIPRGVLVGPPLTDRSTLLQMQSSGPPGWGGEGGGVTGPTTLSYNNSNVTEAEQPYSPSGVVGRWWWWSLSSSSSSSWPSSESWTRAPWFLKQWILVFGPSNLP